MQRSICQGWDHEGLIGVEGGIKYLLRVRRHSKLLILIVLAFLVEGKDRGVKAHPGDSDPEHPKEDVKAHPGKKNGGEGGAGRLTYHFQRFLYGTGDDVYSVGGHNGKREFPDILELVKSVPGVSEGDKEHPRL